ncbi:hypothetical protein ABDJ85_19265, partial [Roseateles sp. DJS-2-20]
WRRSGTSRQLSLKPTTIVNALVRPRPSDLNQRASAIPGALHHNDKQRTSYDAGIWLSWMFYFYLSTIHVVLRKIEHEGRP